MTDADGWVTIASREAFGAIDSWDEYLRATRGRWGYVLDVHRHEWLGEVPGDWFDDDGELLPEHLDDEGCLKLPEKIDGRPVLGCMYGGFVGELVPLSYHQTSVEISDCSENMVRAALETLKWDVACLERVRECLGPLNART